MSKDEIYYVFDCFEGLAQFAGTVPKVDGYLLRVKSGAISRLGNQIQQFFFFVSLLLPPSRAS